MTTSIELGEYATTPLYNIKAVVQATEISSSTLRAWERRYQMCAPQRSESGYRLYSDRDIAKIRWLKAQVDAGMAISQAVAWLDRLVDEAGDEAAAILPFNGEVIVPATAIPPRRSSVRDIATLQSEVTRGLLSYDEQTAETAMAEAFALYPIEQVSEELIVPTLVQIGDLWHDGEISITTEHYATNYLLQRLMTLLRVSVNSSSGPLIWVGCAPGELHEIGALMLTIFLRRSGHNVQYLGHNLPTEDLVAEVERQHPAVVLMSASSSEAAAGLTEMTAALVNIAPPRPIIGYGGRIFNQQPDLRSGIAGVYLGATAQEAVKSMDDLLSTARDRRSRRPNAV